MFGGLRDHSLISDPAVIELSEYKCIEDTQFVHIDYHIAPNF